jgi:hypothetical protein
LSDRQPQALTDSPILIDHHENPIVIDDEEDNEDCGYEGGVENELDSSAQLHVRNFSSKKYKSHRRVPEQVARAFD